MIQLIVQCDKCQKAKVKMLPPCKPKSGETLASAADFFRYTTISHAPANEGDWCFLGDICKLLCPVCLEAYREHVRTVNQNANVEMEGFFLE